MKKREIFIVFVLITFGMLYNLYESGEVEFFFFDECSINPRRLLDKKHVIPFPREEKRYSDLKAVEICNPAGDIVVKKSQDTTAVIKPVIRVYHKDKSKAQRIGRRIEISTRLDNGSVVFNVTPSGNFPYKRARVSFELSLPENVELKLQNGYGKIEIVGAGKNIILDERYGNILVKNVNSSLHIDSRQGKVSLDGISDRIDLYARHSAVTARRISSLKLNASYSNVTVDGVENETGIDFAAYCTINVRNSGKLSIDGRQTRIRLENITNGVYVENSHNSIHMKNVSGDVSVIGRNCRIHLDKVISDNLIVKNSFGDVDIEDVSGKELDLTVSNGDLDLKFIRVSGRINIKNKHSDILLDYPDSLKPLLHFDVEYGKIFNKTEIEYEISKDQQRFSLNSGSGEPEIIIYNTYGDILIRNYKPVKQELRVEPEEFIKPVEKIEKEE